MLPAMTDLNVIFLRPTAEEKQIIAAAAARARRSVNIYCLEASFDRAKSDLQGVVDGDVIAQATKKIGICRHCGHNPLTRRNQSGFCRSCQRTVGLSTLQKLHPTKEVSHGKSVSPSPPTGRTRKRK
jgi:hypothetical protein